jgi:hypothetical protein
MKLFGLGDKIIKYVKYGLTVYGTVSMAALWIDAEVKKRRYRKRKEEEDRKKAEAKPDPDPKDDKKRRR